MVLTPASRSLHPAPGPSPKTQGPGEGAGKTARPCLLATRNTDWTALSLPPAACGSRRLTRAPRRPRGGCGLPGCVPVVTPYLLRRPWTSDRQQRPVSGGCSPGALRAPRGWAGCRPPPTARPDSPAGAATGQGRKRSVAPTLTAGALSGSRGGGVGLPSPLRADVRVSLPPGSPPAPCTQAHVHTHARRNTGPLAQAPRASHWLSEAGSGGDRRHWPLGCGGRIHRPPRAGPREGRGRGRRELCRSTSNPASGRKAGAGAGTPEPRAGNAKSRCPRRRGLVGLTEAGLRPRARGGGGGAGARAPTPPPCPAPSSTVLSAWLCPDPLEAEDGSWLLSDLVRQPFCGIKA